MERDRERNSLGRVGQRRPVDPFSRDRDRGIARAGAALITLPGFKRDYNMKGRYRAGSISPILYLHLQEPALVTILVPPSIVQIFIFIPSMRGACIKRVSRGVSKSNCCFINSDLMSNIIREKNEILFQTEKISKREATKQI